MEMELKNLPVIDWKLGMRLAGNKEDLAQDILQLLVKSLPEDKTSIKQSFITKNYKDLLRQVHKLHGALCYCGTPRLKNVIASLETGLKNNIMTDLPTLLDQFETEVNLLLEHYSLLK